ncbi:MAG: HU family DNA-binding protein [Rickettsiales bacterium]|jgi:DNA-binding protein HU-beta|nr:HU family DNA-binding protein [Rickettsiales bacterium]
MNKLELIELLASEVGTTKAMAGEFLDAFINGVTKVLKKKGEVRLVGFGTFTTAKRKATTGRNPQTGASIKIPASTQPKFKAGKALKDAVNK